MHEDPAPATARLTCVPDTLRAPPAPASLTLQRIDAHSGPEALLQLASALAAAGGDGSPDPSPAQVASLATRLRDGLGLLARIGSTPAGGGLFTTAADGEAHIDRLGLRDPHDEIGLGPVIAAELARLAFRSGAPRVVLATDAVEPYRAAGFSLAD